MTRLDHNRPELRAKDNLRRELNKICKEIQSPASSGKWPTFMHPISTNSKALLSLFELLHALSIWADTHADFDLRSPPEIVTKSFSEFSRQRISSPNAGGLTGEDWLTETVQANRHNNDFRPVLIAFREFWA